MAYVKAVFSFLLAFIQMLIPMASVSFSGSDDYFTKWDENTVYSDNYAIELEKKANKDFVVLNLTDIQLTFGEEYGYAGELAKATIDKLVEETKPDLITVTGDNAWSLDSYVDMIKMLDSYGIPWAPVMGNHDGQGCISEKWCAAKFVQAKNCLFKFGPEGMGYGNYIINITESGEIIHTIFMMDSHSSITETNINGEKGSGYDHFWPEQLKWYEWAINGIKASAGKEVESTVFMHIPVYEYKVAWAEAYGKDEPATESSVTYSGNYADTSFGINHEGVCCAPQNNGFFALCKELGSTKNMVCGHDHVNSSSLLYDGIRLTYGVKCGSGCYWEEAMNGGTTVTVSSNGVATVEHILVDPASLGLSQN